MVTLKKINSSEIQLKEIASGTKLRTLNFWNTHHRCISNVRTLTLPAQEQVTAVEKYLKLPGVRIYSVLSHEPIVSPANQKLIERGVTSLGRLGDAQRIVNTQDEAYIDEFGRYVYIAYGLGIQEDVDKRYDVPTQELFELQHQEQ